MGGVEETRQATKERLWAAVDRLTRSQRQRVDREPESAEWLRDLADDPSLTVCDVAAYRAATVSFGEIPGLWQQATEALTTGSEQQAGGSKPLRERSPADLDLMETMLTIRETLGWQLPGRGLEWRRPGDIPDMMRQFAAHLVTNEPQHIPWWLEYFEMWGRILAKYLRALELQPRPVRLRNAPCPICKTRQAFIEDERTGERIAVPPILVDFENGWIRCATCIVCMSTWWRGDQLGELATQIETQELSDPDGRISA